MIYLPENLYSVKVDKDKCRNCGSALLVFNWKKGVSEEEDKSGEIRCCLMCDDHLLSLCNIKHSRGGSSSSRRPHRGRGKPRGKHNNPLMSFRDF